MGWTSFKDDNEQVWMEAVARGAIIDGALIERWGYTYEGKWKQMRDPDKAAVLLF